MRGEGDVRDALASSLDLRVALARVRPILRRLVASDASALGVFPATPAGSHEWFVDGLPPAFFGGYEDLATDDFVREAVSARPSVVLRDHQMIGRRELERHLLYQRAREAGMPLEHVMAVMLVTGSEGASGLALYRDRRRPFSAGDRATLQRLTPAFARAIQHCLHHARIQRKAAAFDAVGEQLATAIVRKNGKEAQSSKAAEALIERWFTVSERARGGVPAGLMSSVACLQSGPSRGRGSWQRRAGHHVLEVSFLPLPDPAGSDWLLTFEVRHRPAWCDTLTRRERQVLRGLVDRWDNRLLADELRCSIETIKKHVSHILEKAGVDDRNAFANQQYDL
jgi:DNA-binding CsgD family transcriptional regulator